MDALRFQAEHFAEVPAVILACYQLNDALRRMASAWRPVLRGYRALGVRDSLRSLANMQRFTATGEAASIYPGVQNLLLTARALGLGANLTTWHTMLEQDFKAVLGIPRRVHVYAIVPVGYPRGRFGRVRRRPAVEAIHWNAC
jgi:nitroreductase